MKVISLFLLLVFAVDSQASGNLTIWSKLPTVARAKQLLLHGGAMAWLGCATFVGCSVPAPMPESPAVAVQEEETGVARLFHQDIHFRVDGRSYRGRATDRLVGDDKIVVIPRHEAEKVIAIEDISGVLLADHWLIFAQVRAPMNERGLRFVQGEVVAVYTDGYAVVSVSLEIDRRYHKQHPQRNYDAFFPIKRLTVLEEEKKPTTMAAR